MEEAPHVIAGATELAEAQKSTTGAGAACRGRRACRAIAAGHTSGRVRHINGAQAVLRLRRKESTELGALM